MTYIFFKTHPQRWLILLALAALAFFSLAFQGGDTDPAHCYPCATPTFTRTPTFTPTPTWTPTPIPPVQQCQVAEVSFDKSEYQTGDPIKVRLLVKDAQGKPITGANVDATVNRQPFADTVQASAIPPLQDMAGYYDGVYLLTDLPGVYTFTFSVSDFSGPRFSPCSAERVVQVKEKQTPTPQCQIKLEATPNPVTVNNPITLTALVTDTLCTSVTTTVQIPGDGSQTLTPPLAGSGNICTGSYTPALTGTYTFTATGVNSGNQPCTSNPVSVIVNPTATPPPTPTVDLNFPSQPIDLCRLTKPITATLAISNVTNLTGVAVEMSYDKSFIQVIDAFGPPRPPLQQVEVKPDPNFDPWLRNDVDVNRGIIYFAANAHTPVNGQTNVIYIDWQPQGRIGDTTLNVTTVFTDAQGSKTISISSPLKIEIGPPCSAGIVALQGRTDHSGVLVSSAAGEQTRSYPNGLFAIVSTNQLNFTFPGYLAAQSDLPQSAAASATITLRAGDVNGDNKIDILDLAQLAQQYQSADSLADLNGDGVVNILDLALVAGNFQQRGPLTNGQ